ncbi:MAG TPA: hypothetical protein VNJ47_09880 [Nevskiales bacterium]|nr:hypothetical protein [Nevskiales bacterium]
MESVLSRSRRAFLRRSLRRIAGAGLLSSPWAAFMRTESVASAYAVYDDGRGRVRDGRNAYWSWTTVHAFNGRPSA